VVWFTELEFLWTASRHRSVPGLLDSLVALDKKAGTLEVLISLYGKDAVPVTELCRSIPLERATSMRAIRVLQKIGLVSEVDSHRFPFRKTVSLSPLGARLASAPVIEWESILFTQGLVTPGLKTHDSISSHRTGLHATQTPRF